MTADPDDVAEGVLDVGGRPARWLREGRLDGRPLVLLAHGAGAPLQSAFLQAVAEGLVARGLAVARFHFPYMQERVDAGRRRPPDRTPVLLQTWRALLAEAAAWPGGAALVLSGKSLGARMATHVLADGDAPAARAGVWLGYPLHPAGAPDRLRRDHLSAVTVPQLFVSGTRDPLAELPLLEQTVAALGPRARLHLVEGGDHSLAVRRSRPLEGAAAWLDAIVAWLTGIGVSPGPVARPPHDRAGSGGATG